jgi:hypothetical protein
MSESDQLSGPLTSTDSFTAIFKAASTKYQRVTGKCLDTRPFADQLDTNKDGAKHLLYIFTPVLIT